MRIAYVTAALLAALVAEPAYAVTVANGVVIFDQADVIAGNITPGDTPGFPATLSASGVYRLSGNLAPTANNGIGINVTAPEVTIDFFGFRMAGGGSALTGIESTQRALTVTNGTIRGFQGIAIDSAGGQLIVTNMRLAANNYGVFDSSTGYGKGGVQVLNSEIIANTHTGITCGPKCHVESCNIADNPTGINIFSGVVVNNNLNENSTGIHAGSTSTGVGNNSITGGSPSISGSYRSLQPNACSPACATPTP